MGALSPSEGKVECKVKGGFILPANATHDDLLYYLHEAKLTPEQRAYITEQVVSNLDGLLNVDISSGEEFDKFIESYEDGKSIGLSNADIAALLGMSTRKLNGLLNGVGLTEEQHRRLLQAELFGSAKIKRLCLDTISGAVREGNWKAAVSLLEKLFPDEYGKRTEIVGNQTITLGAVECEQKANDAAKALQILRANREIEQGRLEQVPIEATAVLEG